MTVRVYYLETETIDGTERIKGSQYIKNAIAEIEGTERKVIMDTDANTHDALKALAAKVRTALPEEQQALAALDFTPSPPSPLEQRVAALEIKLASLSLPLVKGD